MSHIIIIQDGRETSGERLERSAGIRRFHQETDGEAFRCLDSRLPVRFILVCSGRIDDITRELRGFASTYIGNGGMIAGNNWDP